MGSNEALNFIYLSSSPKAIKITSRPKQVVWAFQKNSNKYSSELTSGVAWICTETVVILILKN